MARALCPRQQQGRSLQHPHRAEEFAESKLPFSNPAAYRYTASDETENSPQLPSRRSPRRSTQGGGLAGHDLASVRAALMQVGMGMQEQSHVWGALAAVLITGCGARAVESSRAARVLSGAVECRRCLRVFERLGFAWGSGSRVNLESLEK